MIPPPKPWEVGSTASNGKCPVVNENNTASSSVGTSSNVPIMPARPTASQAALLNQTGIMQSTAPSYGNGYSQYNRYGANGYGGSYGANGYGGSYGASGYGNTYGASGYGNTYGGGYGSTYGGYGSSYGTGYSPYNRYGTTMGGYNRFGGMGNQMNGPMMGPNGLPIPEGELPLTARLEQSTQATFQMLDQIVQAFGGFSQMLESTFFATHSSFMAMAGVAEQFGMFRTYLGQALSVFSLMEFIRNGLNWIRGVSTDRGIQGSVDVTRQADTLTVDGFSAFEKEQNQLQKSGPSKRPLWVFLAVVIGLPWLMSKLISQLRQRKLEQQEAAIRAAALNGESLVDPNRIIAKNGASTSVQLHPSQIRNLEFCRATYAFAGDAPGDLSLQPGDIVAVLARSDPVTGEATAWWRGRTQAGAVGIFPGSYVEILPRKDSHANTDTVQSNPSAPFSTEFSTTLPQV
ncbi:hypothetical protein BDV3_001870 [Batrachochytrium dendrobatidis]|uniref:Peroxisomal membrane protein PEX13 n=1 Tax=Batrachochytrium dendrobatidis (strain JEL423) TaxID=403673 RepID=A0A177WTP4_BATDL|nr:hypothetical protein BDEG_26390 [Batrachochytrium dendrobatidis JEL423]